MANLNVLTICGSLRKGSYNAMVQRALPALAPEGMTLTPAPAFTEFPLYNADIQNTSGFPADVTAFADAVRAADGIIIVSPEYNWSIPAGLKNAIDWMSRPASDIPHVFGAKPVAIAGATPGPGGTALSQAAWLPVIRTLGMLPWFQGRLMISGAGKLFDGSGAIVDAATSERVRLFITGFAAFADAISAGSKAS